MTPSFTLSDSASLGDLATYLGRAGRVEEGSVRLIAGSGILAVYSAILYPAGLLDDSPTVLGLRTMALADRTTQFDAVVPVRSLLERLKRVQSSIGDGPATVSLPVQVSTVTWAGISPPKGGWTKVGDTVGGVLDRVARAGIDEVADTIPTGTGEQIVRRVRSEVWGRPIPEVPYIPAGAGFAALSLGFLGERDEAIPVYESGPWSRVTTRRGHILIRRRAWSLLG
ncbi:MAG: hypothetical protein ABWZ77_07600 [Naasia sp.]